MIGFKENEMGVSDLPPAKEVNSTNFSFEKHFLLFKQAFAGYYDCRKKDK
jgi:hypothetical protein